MASSVVRWVDPDLIEEPLHELRPTQKIDQGSEHFQEILTSMREEGFWESKPIEVYEEGEFYVRTDGGHRWLASKILGLDSVPVVVIPKLNESENLERQIKANALVIETRPVEYSRGVSKWLDLNPGATLVDASKTFRKSVGWIRQRMKVAKLEGAAETLTNEGKIPLDTAAELAKLQAAGGSVDDYLDRAQHEPAKDVIPDIKAATKSAKTKKAEERKAQPRLRPLGDIRAELERAEKQETPCYVAALKWALRLDPATQLMVCGDPSGCPMAGEDELDSSRLVNLLLHWGLGAGADPKALADFEVEVEPAQQELQEALDVFESPKELAETLGVNVSTARRWLKGEQTPSFDARLKLLDL